jgi:hypothetical protein
VGVKRFLPPLESRTGGGKGLPSPVRRFRGDPDESFPIVAAGHEYSAWVFLACLVLAAAVLIGGALCG